MRDPLAGDRYLSRAETRLILCNLLLACVMLGPECSDACTPDAESLSETAFVPAGAGVSEATFPTYRIEVTGTNHRWQAKYRWALGRWTMAGNGRIGEPIHVPRGAPTVVVLKSTDFVYLFAIPELGLREIAVPGLEFKLEFRPLECGRFSIAGQRLCEETPAVLPAELVVESPEKSRAWHYETALAQSRRHVP